MSGIRISVKDEKEKAKVIEEYLCGDEAYLKKLDEIREDLKAKGIDPATPEGRKLFIIEVRSLNKDLLRNQEGG